MFLIINIVCRIMFGILLTLSGVVIGFIPTIINLLDTKLRDADVHN